MGLANQFGDQGAYKCTNCGHKVALYAPCCPRCLDNTLVRTEPTPERYRPVTREVSMETERETHPLSSIAVLAIILAIAFAVAIKFSPPPSGSITRPEMAPSVVSTPTEKPRVSSTARVSNNQPGKRSKNTPPVSKTNRPSTTGSLPDLPPAKPARPATPMKLWEESSDDASGN